MPSSTGLIVFHKAGMIYSFPMKTIDQEIAQAINSYHFKKADRVIAQYAKALTRPVKDLLKLRFDMFPKEEKESMKYYFLNGEVEMVATMAEALAMYMVLQNIFPLLKIGRLE